MAQSDEMDRDDAMLDGFFEAAREASPVPSEAVLGRILADADRVDATRTPDPRAAPRRSLWAGIAGIIGGWPAMASMATAAAAGVWIGVAQPDALDTLTGGMLSGDDGQFVLEDFAPGYAAFVSFDEGGAQ